NGTSVHKQANGQEQVVLMKGGVTRKPRVELLETIAEAEQEIRAFAQQMTVGKSAFRHESLEIITANTRRVAHIGHRTESSKHGNSCQRHPEIRKYGQGIDPAGCSGTLNCSGPPPVYIIADTQAQVSLVIEIPPKCKMKLVTVHGIQTAGMAQSQDPPRFQQGVGRTLLSPRRTRAPEQNSQ